MAVAGTKPARSNPGSGISMEMLIPGKFYQCIQPGHFTDSLTGIVIPGPRAILDGSTKRTVVGLTDLPEPIQLPHFKLVIELSESGKEKKEIEKDFNAADEQPVHEAFQLALATGIIRMVPDEEMEESYPETYEKRVEKLVWRHENVQRQTPMVELLHQARDENLLLRISQNHDNVPEAKKEIARRGAAIDETRTEVTAPAKPKPPPKP